MSRTTAAECVVTATQVDSSEEIRTLSKGMGGTGMPTLVTLQGQRYQLRRQAGEGESSTVWCITDEAERPWALKLGKSKAVGPTLALEAERLMWIGSSSVARLVDAGRLPSTLDVTDRAGQALRLARDTPFLIMEWCDGERLDALDVPLEERSQFAVQLLCELGRALADVHGAGVAHGDVKPANILVERTPLGPRARLVDLGLAHAADQGVPSGGTPRYLAPEVFDPSLKGDGRARDLYALALSVAEFAAPALREAPDPGAGARAEAWPEPLGKLLLPLLHLNPAARPSAAWLWAAAAEAAAVAPNAERTHARRQAAIKRSYLAVRRTEWAAAARHATTEVSVEGAPGQWLHETIELARKLVLLRRERLHDGSVPVAELNAIGHVRWLTQLCGAAAAHWPAPRVASDAELAERLHSALHHVEPASLTLRQLTTGRSEQGTIGSDPVDVALALSAATLSPQVLQEAERLVERGRGTPQLVLVLGKALRLRGELGRAIVVLSRLETAESALELAELWRRAGDAERALEILSDLPSGSFTSAELGRAAAIRARVALDRGELEQALTLLAEAPESAQVLETRALVLLASNQLEAAHGALEHALVLAANDEERARIFGTEGMLFHARGDSERAQGRFEAAAEHAQRVGAVLEEATYLTGVAAAASDRGSFGAALAAAERATLLFEQLGKSRAAARAALARAAVFSSLGLVAETKRAVAETESRAREAADVTCLGYAHLAMADALPKGSHEARDHAERAAQLLGPDNPSDRLRAATRLLNAGLPVDLSELDALARSSIASSESHAASIPAGVRLEWWGARAERCLELEPEGGAAVLTELEMLAAEQAPCVVRGRALTAGVALALALGDTDGARRLSAGASVAARELRRLAPPELMRAVEGLAWVALARGPGKTEFLPEQLEDVERLVLALGKRDRLRPLFDQVLDALVLWTGVERGLLLLRAPGDRLTPRAARNLAKSDLSGEQLRLSYSLAARALEQQQPVVAIDAAGELPELHASVHALKLRSVLAVPLVARGHTLGVVYLDDRERRGAFGARELGWVKLVATLAAVAIADARDQLLLRRAMRRAQRAEAKVAERLARREVELEVAERELARTRGIRETRYAYEAIVGESPALCRMLAVVDRVTASDVSVLLVGESGVGKELIARAIHTNGPRGKQPFVGENCAAIPEGLLESTLFGHVRGAFTGAERPRAGLFEAASGGTLFLDEIGEMSLSMQSKLLRVLQDGEVRPVGSERAHKVDVRVIAATHRDLLQMVKQGTFREDLYYRLNVITIQVPPLRERVGDIERLVHHFVRIHAPERRVRVTPEAFAVLGRYDWPGNIRQLENEVQRFLVIGDDVIDPSHLSAAVQGEAQRAVPQDLGLNVRRHVDALETELVLSALEKTGGNQTRAAELLGLSRFGLQKMMKRLEITPRRPALRRLPSRLSDAG